MVLFIVTFDVVEPPQDKLVLLIAYVIMAINSPKNASCHVTEKPVTPEDSKHTVTNQ